MYDVDTMIFFKFLAERAWFKAASDQRTYPLMEDFLKGFAEKLPTCKL